MRRCGNRLACLPCALRPSSGSGDALAFGPSPSFAEEIEGPVDTLTPARIEEIERGIKSPYAWRRLLLSLLLSMIGGVEPLGASR